MHPSTPLPTVRSPGEAQRPLPPSPVPPPPLPRAGPPLPEPPGPPSPRPEDPAESAMSWALERMGDVGAAERARTAKRWLRALDEGEVAHLVEKRKQPPPSRAPSSRTKRYASSLLPLKEKIGLAANDFFKSFQKEPGRVGWVQAFCVSHFGVPAADVPRATKEFVRRCSKMVQTSEYAAGEAQ